MAAASSCAKRRRIFASDMAKELDQRLKSQNNTPWLPACFFLNGFGLLRSLSQAWQQAVQASVEATGRAASNSMNALTYSTRPSIASSHFRTNVSAARYLRFDDE